jgi:hypothetical protein
MSGQIGSQDSNSDREGIEVLGPAGALPSADSQDISRLAVDATGRFYGAFWSARYLVPPLSVITALFPTELEIGSGLHSRLSIAGASFVDISQSARSLLTARGGLAKLGGIVALPFSDGTFDSSCALDTIEHIEDDRRAFRELAGITEGDARWSASRLPCIPHAGVSSMSPWVILDAAIQTIPLLSSESILLCQKWARASACCLAAAGSSTSRYGT